MFGQEEFLKGVEGNGTSTFHQFIFLSNVYWPWRIMERMGNGHGDYFQYWEEDCATYSSKIHP